jgi:hypothetical protein
MAINATAEYYEVEDCATKLIPALSPLLIDKEKFLPLSLPNLTRSRIVRVQAAKALETILARIKVLTVSMPDTALTTPAETPRPITPSAQSSENFALAAGSATLLAGSAIAGWAITGLTKKVLGTENGDVRPESAPPTQSRFNVNKADTSAALRGTVGDVDGWKDEEVDDDLTKAGGTRQWSSPASSVGKVGMKLGGGVAGNKASVVEKVVEEERKNSLDDSGAAAAWGDDWEEDDKEDGWGFDD